MADLVVEESLSMVLDLSNFGSRTQERTFVATFLDRLYRTNRQLVHLIVDGADLFAPQKPRREDGHLWVTMENIVRRGRNRALGITNNLSAGLHAKVQAMVAPAKWRILEAVIAEHPNPIRKEVLAQRVAASASSGSYANNLLA